MWRQNTTISLRKVRQTLQTTDPEISESEDNEKLSPTDRKIPTSSSSSWGGREPLIFATLPWKFIRAPFLSAGFSLRSPILNEIGLRLWKKAGGRKRFKRVGRIRDLQVNRTILSIWWDVESVLLTHRLRIRISLVFYMANLGNDSRSGDDYFDMISADGDTL